MDPLSVGIKDINAVASGVTAGTRLSYRAAPTLWKEFVTMELMESIDNLYLVSLSQEQRALCLVRFLMWLTESKEISPNPACRLLTGVRHSFVITFHDATFFASEQIRLAKKGVRAGNRHVRFVTRKNGQPLPFTIELLASLRVSHWSSPVATIDMQMCYIAVAFGTCLGSRPGEVSSDGPYKGENATSVKEDHRFFLSDLYFEEHPSLVDGGNYTFLEYVSLPHPRPLIDLIRVTKDSSKVSGGLTDGQTYYLTRGNYMETQFFEDLIEWLFVRCKITTDNLPLFCRNAYVSKDQRRMTSLKLTTKKYVEAMRVVATEHGIPEDCFTGKSPRIFASTNTTLAGRSSIHTQNLLGHSSESSSLKYQSLIASSQLNEPILDPNWKLGSTSTVFADPCMLSIRDLKRAVSQRIVLKESQKKLKR